MHHLKQLALGIMAWVGCGLAGAADAAKPWPDFHGPGRRNMCLGHRGVASLLAPTSGGFRLVSQFQLAETPTNTCLAHPVVADGRLYLRAGRELHCYDIRRTPATVRAPL